MASYRIVCTEQSDPNPYHGHIIAVGTGASPSKATEKWTVAEVRAAIRKGNLFYTVSPSTGAVAYVEPYDCWCGYRTIRSKPDQVTDDNLDSLRACSWAR